MFRISTVSSNRVDIELSGKLDAETMRKGLEDLVEQSEGIQYGTMLYTIKDFEVPSAGALGVELGYLPKLFGMITKFDRCAVLCDIAWIRRVAEIEGALFPGLAIRAFSLKCRDEAEHWLTSEVI